MSVMAIKHSNLMAPYAPIVCAATVPAHIKQEMLAHIRKFLASGALAILCSGRKRRAECAISYALLSPQRLLRAHGSTKCTLCAEWDGPTGIRPTIEIRKNPNTRGNDASSVRILLLRDPHQCCCRALPHSAH
jgi:hypothetical protein